MKIVNKKTREAKDASIYLKLVKFYDKIKAVDYWKTIFLVLIKLSLQNDRIDTEKLYGHNNDKYIEEIQYHLPIVLHSSDHSAEVVYMFLNTFSQLSLSTKVIMQQAVNNLVCDNALSEKVISAILNGNGYGMDNILFPETLKKIFQNKKYSKLSRWSALGFLVRGRNNFVSIITEENLKRWCDEISLSSVAYLSYLEELRDNDGDIIKLLPNIVDKDFNNVYPYHTDSIREHIQDIIINNGLNTYYTVDEVRCSQSGAGYVCAIFPKCCYKMRKLIKETVKELFVRHIIKNDDKSFISAKFGFRQLADEEVLWLEELKKAKLK
ncbi:MAG: hypothetical protein NTY12_01255 [Candidatus Falkowbacteria bacterium]|nr:hypothetical protein [Candidatus Falkowbacteria bacterium]